LTMNFLDNSEGSSRADHLVSIVFPFCSRGVFLPWLCLRAGILPFKEVNPRLIEGLTI
jgi:hypothetical protein